MKERLISRRAGSERSFVRLAGAANREAFIAETPGKRKVRFALRAILEGYRRDHTSLHNMLRSEGQVRYNIVDTG